MARNARSKDSCRFCGDRSVLSEDTWAPTGLCAAHSAAPVKAARKARNAARRDDREVVVTVSKVETDNGNRCVQTYRGEVWVNADGEPI